MAEALLDQALDRWGLAAAKRTRLAGDVSHRRYYRLRGAGLAGTAVAMVTPLEEAHKMADWIAIGRYLHGHGLAVPQVLERWDEGCVLLITDVGDTLLTGADDSERWYQSVIGDLARLEAEAAGEPATASPAHARSLEEIRIRWELRRFRKVVAAPLRDLDDDELAAWKDGEDAMVAALTRGRQSWMHRDLHARNILVHEQRAWWIDFQDAMIGPWLYDLASFLSDPYAALPAERRDAGLAAYLAQPGRVHGDAGAGEIAEQWRLVTVQRLVHCAACYIWVKEHEANGTYVRYLPHTLACLHDAMTACPTAAPLARVMASRWAPLFERQKG